MDEKDKNINKPVKRTSIFRKVLNVFIVLFSLLFLAITAFFILIQTDFFKTYLLHVALDKVNEGFKSKESTIYIESIEGGLLSKFSLNKISVVVKKDTMLKVDKLIVDYNLWKILEKNIYVNSVELVNPEINFTKIKTAKDTLWNFAYLLKSKEVKPEDTTKKEFNWGIEALKFKLINGNFRMLDFKKSDVPIRNIKMDSIKYFDINHLDVTNLNIDLSGKYYKDRKAAFIRNISLNTNSPIAIKELSLIADLRGEDKPELKDFKLVTNRSNIAINYAKMTPFNLFDKIEYENFGDKDADVDILLDWADIADLTFFIPQIKFLDGRYYVKLKASGKYNDINLQNLSINSGRSVINASGKVKNLNRPENLYLDINARNVVLDPNDEKLGLPGIPLPDFRNVGKVSGDFTFVGEPLRFSATFDIKSAAGNASGDGRIDLKQSEMAYFGKIKASNVNLSKILNVPSLQGVINTEFTAEGKGVNYRTMSAKLNYILTNTSIFGQNISHSGGEIKLSSGVADLDVTYISNTVNAAAKGNIDFRNFEDVKYNIQGLSKNLDFSTLTKREADKSNMNFTYSIIGSGFSLDDITKGNGFNPDKLFGEYRFNVDNSNLENFSIPQSPLAVSIKFTESGDKKLFILSNFIDLEAEGKFSFLTMPEIISANLQNIGKQIADRINLNDTIHPVNIADSNITHKLPNKFDNMHFKYKMNIKSFMPVNLFMKDTSLTFKGTLEGEVDNRDNIFVFNTKGKVNYFSFKDTLVKFQDADLMVNLTQKNSGDIFKNLNADIYFITPRLIANGSPYDSIFVKLQSNHETNNFSIKGRIDTTVSVKSSGNLDFGEKRISIILDTLNLGLKSYKFQNDDTLIVYFVPDDSNGVSINNFFFDKFSLLDSNQRISINGLYSINDTSNLVLIASKISIPKLQKFASNDENKEYLLKGNIRRLKVNYSGTLKDPVLSAELNTEQLSFDKYSIGRLDALIDYSDNLLKPEIAFYNKNNQGKLLINGEAPFQNPLFSKEKIDLFDKNVNFNVIADNFQIKILEQFLPFIKDLDARLNSNINVKGKVNSPDLSGNMNIDSGKFTLDLTNVRYNFNTIISTAGKNLIVNRFRLIHPSDDSRFLTVFGNVGLTNLLPSDILLNIAGDVKILDNTVSYNKLGVYGDILAGVGSKPLRITGDISGLILSGDLIVKKGKVVIPPSKRDAYNLYTDNIAYRVLVDSASFKKDTIILISPQKDSTRAIFLADPFDKSFVSTQKQNEQTSKKNSAFIYDLTIVTENKLFVNMIIDEKTKQEFVGEIMGTLYADNKDNDKLQIRGRADLSDNSTYKFYKNFNATGFVTFTGEVTNPELNITADYRNNTTDPNTNLTRAVQILLGVTGKAQKPNLKWQVLVDGSSFGGNDPTDEAISFILFGKLKDELNASQRLDLVSNVGANVSTTLLSGYLSKFVSDFLPFILNADINYVSNQGGSVAENTDIRFTAGFGDATIRFGGQILTDLSNTNFKIEYPINKLLKLKALSNNLIFMFERVVDPFSQNKMLNTNIRTGGSILYQFKF